MKPNLFAWATKELSQDAMICWLIEWSATPGDNKADRELRDLGRGFVGALIDKHGVKLTGAVQRAEIHRQKHGIDVLARIHDEDSPYVLLIEDKTHTSAHSDQLQRYRDLVSGGHTVLGEVPDHLPLYFKTGNQSLAEDADIEQIGYRVFLREDLLEVLKGYHGTHPIVTDFREHIQKLEDDFNSFCDWRREDAREEWTWAGWEGFYRRLEHELGIHEGQVVGWGYVPNQAGGFLGFWRFTRNAPHETEFYVQLEVVPGESGREKLCFKASPGEDGAEAYAQEFYDVLRSVSGEERIERPPRFGRRGSGTMTVGWWRREWLAFDVGGKVDLNRIADNVRQASQLASEAQCRWRSRAE